MLLKSETFSKPTYYLESSEEIACAISAISKAEEIGVDTESDSLYAFNERVCAIQISTRTDNYVFDPILEPPLDGLKSIFSDTSILKVFHGSDYDIGLLKRDFGFAPTNIFDTMVAAQFLNFPHIGMADLVEQCHGFRLQKKYTKCNWSKRPLTLDQMLYLCQDTQYLLELHDWLAKALEEKNLVEEAAIECHRLEQRPPLEPAYRNQQIWDIKGINTASREDYPFINELFVWRQKTAERLNIPPFKVLDNSLLLLLARNHPFNIHQMSLVKSIPPAIIQRYGDGITRAIRKGSRYPSDWQPPARKIPEHKRSVHWNDQELVDRLRKWRTEVAVQRDIHPLAVLSGIAIEEIARRKPRSAAELAVIETVGSKRAAIYGGDIIAIVQQI